jgi:hypothetical protein
MNLKKAAEMFPHESFKIYEDDGRLYCEGIVFQS